MKEKYFVDAIKMAKKSLKHDDVPVGAVIVMNNKIISKGFNRRKKNNLIIEHAEINAIMKANKRLKSYFLNNCDLYVTLKPCSMCEKVINNARIRNVFYLLEKPENKKEFEKTTYQHVENNLSTEYAKILSNFFYKLR